MIVKINEKFVKITETGDIITTEIGCFAAEEMDGTVLPIVQEIVGKMDEDNISSFTYRDITKRFHIGNVKLGRILDFLDKEGFLRRIQ